MPEITAGPYTTAYVAEQLGVSPQTVRRYIRYNILPEPGWSKQNRRKEREYSDAWLKKAKKILGKD